MPLPETWPARKQEESDAEWMERIEKLGHVLFYMWLEDFESGDEAAVELALEELTVEMREDVLEVEGHYAPPDPPLSDELQGALLDMVERGEVNYFGALMAGDPDVVQSYILDLVRDLRYAHFHPPDKPST